MLVLFFVDMYIAIIISLLVASNIATLTFLYFTNKNNKQQISGIKSFMEQMDQRMTKALVINPVQSAPSPNEATQEDDEVIPLDEQTPWQIPQDVKVEVEGDTSNVPFGFEVTNANS